MAVPISTNRVQYDGNGSQTSFPYTFRIFEDADLVVIYTSAAGTDTTWTLNTQYTVTGADLVFGGNVVVKTTPVDYTPPSGSKLTIYREVDITQESDYVENAPFHADTLEDDLDKGIMIDQQLTDQIGRAITVPASDSSPSLELPNAADRANKYLKFDADGDVEVADLPADNIEDGTDNHVARYHGTDHIQDSLVIIGDTGVITTPTGDSNKWDTAYGWGDHSIVGYATSAELIATSGVLAAALTTHKSSGDHDGRYYTQTQLNAGQLDTRYYTETELNNGQLDTRYYTETEINSMLTSYATDAEVATISGDIVAQIPSLAGYATESYVDTVSGALHTEIENIDLNFISNAEMTVISGDIIAQIPTDYYTQGQIATISGDIVAQINASGTLDHSALINLDYASSGHTGFQASGDYVTTATLTTVSGDIVNQIPTDYISDSEMTTISGDIIAQIPTDYISDSEMTTISGDLVLGYTQADTTLSGLLHAEIVAASGTTDHSVLDNLDYASSGHTGFQASGDYVTESEFTTYSGDIIAQIPTDYISDSEMTTISGDLVLGYTAADTTLSGLLHAEIVAASGTTDHSLLTSLDYASSGHTGFVSDTFLTTVSGDLVIGYTAADAESYSLTTYYTDAAVSGVTSSLTSHTSNSTIHFTVASISHSAIDNLDADDHTQYHNDTRGDARYFTQSQITTQSGDIVSQIITDHGLLTGREDDDHIQYILVNGNRAFTGTVAGITPSADEHLATKGYVDAAWGTGLSVAAGTQVLVSGTSSTTIDFGIEFLSTGYGLACEMQNLVDANPSIYDMTITEVTTSGCSLEFSGVIDSGNYYLRYTAIASGTVSSTDHGALSGLLDDDHPQYYNEARGDARYYTEAEVDSLVNTTSGALNSSKANTVHTHVKADILDLGTPISNVVEDTTPQLGGDLDLNGKSLNYGTILTSSGTYVGDYFTATVDDASSVFGSVLYQGADFHYDRADADSTSTSPVFVLALEAGTGSKKLLIRGQVCDTAWNWAAGKLYLSTDTGLMTQTKPSGSGDIIQVLGFALSADTIWFDPVTMVAEVA